jgi:hypothetical protein
MKWIWRVKKWSLSGTIDWDVLTPSSHGKVEFFSTSSLQPDRLNPPGDNVLITREAELVLFYEATDYTPFDYTFTDSSSAFFDAGPSAVVGGTNVGAGAETQIIYSGGLFYPICGFYCLIGGSNDDEGYGFEVSTADLGTGTFQDIGKLTIDGNETRIYATSLSDSGLNTATIVVDLTLEPSEFWPYG